MSIDVPLYRQEKPNTCALACLRMVLAAFGTSVEESDLQTQAHLQPNGVEIGELERLARQYGLVANIQETTVDELQQLLAEGKLPIAYIDRAVFDLTPPQRAKHSLRQAKMHNVVLTRVTGSSIWYNDFLQPRLSRRTISLFRAAYERLASHCVLCLRGVPTHTPQ